MRNAHALLLSFLVARDPSSMNVVVVDGHVAQDLDSRRLDLERVRGWLAVRVRTNRAPCSLLMGFGSPSGQPKNLSCQVSMIC